MSEGNRLSQPAGLLLDRSRPIEFTFEERGIRGFAGDTVASALAAGDQWVLSRSFKYHRPRGILSMSGQDANTLVQLPSDPNALADKVGISDGLPVAAQNYSGSLHRDRDAFVGRLAKFLPVGFYYRTFFRPAGIWEYWSRFFRGKAGLGVIDTDVESPPYDKQYLFCDLLVVGAGPAGMTAASDAADAGLEVLLVDENPVIGGSLNYRIDGRGATGVLEELVARVSSHRNIRTLTNATANGWFTDNWMPVISGNRMYKVRATDVALCTGTLEQHAVFRNNDLPGVMMSTAALRLIHLYGVRPGKRGVVLTGNDDGYPLAVQLLAAGIDVAAVIEMRTDAPVNEAVTELEDRGIPIMTGHAVYEAHADQGKHHLERVDIRRIVGDGQCAGSGEFVDCDLLCMAVGFMPCYQLACQAGAELTYDDDNAMFEIIELPDKVCLAGAANGCTDLESTLADAAAAVRQIMTGTDRPKPQRTASDFNWPIFPHPDGKDFIDFDEDLQVADIINAVRDGYEHVQLVKRFSTCGMGPSQGRHSALPMARLVARETGKSVAETGVTTARPPFAAEKLGHCAGRSFYPARRSNMHHRHAEAGANWLLAGAWYRPAWYGSHEDRDRMIRDEVIQVRENAGLVDVSTLGGIEIRGPDAGELLNRLYTTMFTTLAEGRARYALMTNDAGVVIDDGVACRLADQHFYVTATTGGVDRVFRSMLQWQAQWQLDVAIVNVTSAWCGVNIAGPNSRAVLQKICTDTDLSAEAFPYMSVREGAVAGMPARIIRVGFVGELGYEIHVAQHSGEALWDALMEAGGEFGLGAFGIEAQRVLRMEKGHVIVGQDTDAMSNPLELGMQWALSKKKDFFVGKRSIDELGRRPLERSLVGFVNRNEDAPVPMESHLVIDHGNMVGRVTSACLSPTVNHVIGLAYVPPDLSDPGTLIDIRCEGGTMLTAEVVDPPFYDPGNHRQEV